MMFVCFLNRAGDVCSRNKADVYFFETKRLMFVCSWNKAALSLFMEYWLVFYGSWN